MLSAIFGLYVLRRSRTRKHKDDDNSPRAEKEKSKPGAASKNASKKKYIMSTPSKGTSGEQDVFGDSLTPSFFKTLGNVKTGAVAPPRAGDDDEVRQKKRSLGGMGPEIVGGPLRKDKLDELQRLRQGNDDELLKIGSEATDRLVMKNKQGFPSEWYIPVTAVR